MTAEPDIRVILTDEQEIEVDHDRVVEVAMRTARSEGARGEISITLVPADRMAQLHLEYMNEPGPTDVLSFPVDGLVQQPPGDLPGHHPAHADVSGEDGLDGAGPPIMIGEVVVCPAAARGGENLASEVDLLVAHGVLHLLGHDHGDGPGARRMRAAEKRLTGRSGARAR